MVKEEGCWKSHYFLFLSVGITMLLPRVTQKIVDDGLIVLDIDAVILWCAFYSALFFVQIMLDYVRERKRINIYLDVKKELNVVAIMRLWIAKYTYFSKKKTAEITNDISYDAEMLASLFDNEMLFGFTQIFNIIGGCFGLALINIKMMLVILVLFPVKVLLVKRFSKKNRETSDVYIALTEKSVGFETDSLDGVKEIKIYGLFSMFEKKLKSILGETFFEERTLHVLPQMNVAVDNFLAQTAVLFIYIVGALEMMRQNMSLGSIVAFITYSAYVIGPISTILNIRYKIAGIIPSEERLSKLLETNVEDYSQTKDFKNVQGGISFKNVSFAYTAERTIFRNLEAEIKENDITAIVGDNGCGKTTFINLLLRLYEPDKGDIFIGEKSLKNVDLEVFRENIAFVAQEPFLFCDSIKNNLTLYRKVEEKSIQKVCYKCGLADLVKDVSLDYNVGERGRRLSGGQRQKIAIARAILSERRYIILDEAMSNIDKSGKKEISDMLVELKKTRTIIMVTHDAELISRVDNIIHL
ncbi:MAG: ABC transporter ATP-binding protein [Lachnospiraceae bacterium]|nr:ABC transporter ATP-binding protein [Lachnospiraceae bacterium]